MISLRLHVLKLGEGERGPKVITQREIKKK
jgi:hypothetical protein